MAREGRDAIWSVREGARTAYFVVFVALFGTGMGLLVAAGGSDPEATMLQMVVTYWIAAGGMAIASATGSLITVEIGGQIMVLLDRALDARDARREAWREEGRAERDQELAERDRELAARDRAMAAHDREMAARERELVERDRELDERQRAARAWYERLLEARAHDRTFDEPPPFADANGRSA